MRVVNSSRNGAPVDQVVRGAEAWRLLCELNALAAILSGNPGLNVVRRDVTRVIRRR